MVDVIVNHVSARSRPFLDWLANGERSEYDGMFLTFAGVFPDGATEEDAAAALPAASRAAVHAVPARGRHQAAGLDDVHAAADRRRRAAPRARGSTCQGARPARRGRGATGAAGRGRLCREDAGADLVHDPGDVRVHRRRHRLVPRARPRGARRGALATTASRSRSPSRVDRVYDFALPPLVLHALTAADADPLLAWLAIRPPQAVTVLDTHDGIGVIDVGADAGDRSRSGCSHPSRSTGWSRRSTTAAEAPRARRPAPPPPTSTCTR